MRDISVSMYNECAAAAADQSSRTSCCCASIHETQPTTGRASYSACSTEPSPASTHCTPSTISWTSRGWCVQTTSAQCRHIVRPSPDLLCFFGYFYPRERLHQFLRFLSFFSVFELGACIGDGHTAGRDLYCGLLGRPHS